MSILNEILEADGMLETLARAAGLSNGDTWRGVEALAPMVARGIERRVDSAEGFESLVEVVGAGSHARCLAQPHLLAWESTRAAGNRILGHIFEQEAVSCAISARAARELSIDQTSLRELLPLVASIVVAALSRDSSCGTNPRAQRPTADLLASILQRLGSRSKSTTFVDDILDLAREVL